MGEKELTEKMCPCSRCGRPRLFVPAPGQLEREANYGPSEDVPDWAPDGRLSQRDSYGNRYLLYPRSARATERDRWSAIDPRVGHCGECSDCAAEGRMAASLWNAFIEDKNASLWEGNNG